VAVPAFAKAGRSAVAREASGGWRVPRAVRKDTMVKDPVCGMTIDEKTAKGQSEYKGQTYYFCAAICKTRFDQNPAKYVKN
jgi:Cu+-exporting ATPase